MSTSRYVEVVPLLEVDKGFTYKIDASLGRIEELLGYLVIVPWKNSLTSGVIVSSLDDAGNLERIKQVKDIILPFPLLTSETIKLAYFMSSYYLTPIGTVIKSILPSVSSLIKGIDISLGEPEDKIQSPLLERLKRARNQSIKYSTIKKDLPDLNWRDIVELEKNGFINISLDYSSKDLLEDDGYYWIDADVSQNTKGKDKAFLTEVIERDKPILGKEFVALFKGKRALLKKLIEDEHITPYHYTSSKLPWDDFLLSPDQERVFKSIKEGILEGGGKRYFLYGVTGSGKTYIYLHLIKMILDMGKQALLLVPEISLTPQNLSLFKSIFNPTEIGVYHSLLSRGMRLSIWEKVYRSRLKLIIGPRSSLFLPFKDLGIIIVDEEYEGSYKQGQKPHYHARRISLERGRLAECPVILSSATPSVETFYFAKGKKYDTIELRRRYQDKPLPDIELIDMKRERLRGNFGIMSNRLIQGVNQCLSNNKQSIILFNRRGFASFLICNECGEILSCPHCTFNLTYYLEKNLLKCHYCLYKAKPPDKCPSCRKSELKIMGAGTERLELEVKRLFPKARVLRIDRDTAVNDKYLTEALESFGSGEYDILLGTQIIAKGLHFPNITLVGVIGVDIGLNIPDFRASERIYQLLTQVAGRSGRGEDKGKVLVQTYTPLYPVFNAVSNCEYESYYNQELVLRRQYNYPPFVSLILITFSSIDETEAEESSRAFYDNLTDIANRDSLIVDQPFPALIFKKKDLYRWQVLIRTARATEVKGIIRQMLVDANFKAKIEIDVDPLTII